MTINPDLTAIGYKVNSVEEVREHCPAAFSTHESEKVSDRYSFVPTYDLLNAFNLLGWHPTHTRQNGSSLYARHAIRLVNDSLGFMDLKSDKVRPQIVLDNSHNGSSNTQIHMGLFRLVCTNGLVVAMPGMYSKIKLRHVGIDMEQLKNLLEEVAVSYTEIGHHIGDMQRVILTQDQKEEMVIKAVAAREPMCFINEDGTINVSNS